MNKKSHFMLYSFMGLLVFIGFEVLYLQLSRGESDEKLEKKFTFVSLSGLPDLALASETPYLRHRSLSTPFMIYKDDAVLREHAISTYVLSHAKINYEK